MTLPLPPPTFGGSALLGEEGRPLGAQPLPWVLEWAASKVADSTAFVLVHSGHRGLANNSSRQRAVAYVTYSCGAATDQNFPSATTLAWD